MRDFFKPWRRKVGVATLGLAIAGVLMCEGVQLIGFDTGNCIHDQIDGVKIKIFHPRFVDFRCIGVGIFKDGTTRNGFQTTYQWTVPFGKSRLDRHVVAIVDFRLSVDGRDYGSVAPGDTVVVGESAVTISQRRH